MERFSFKATVEILLNFDKESGRTTLQEVEPALVIGPGIKPEIFIDEDGLPTNEGVKIMTQAFIQGLLGVMQHATSELGLDWRGQVNFVHHEFLRGAEAYEKEMMAMTTPMEEQPAPRKETPPDRHSTNVDLVADLTSLNLTGDYNRIIDNAKRMFYHDFKQPDHVEMEPKMLLADHLSRFPELKAIRDKVISGYYDEAPDEEDDKAMMDLLTKDFKKLKTDGIQPDLRTGDSGN